MPLAPPDSRFSLRVYYEDTDAGGVVYYANYLKFFERARTEWLRALGFGQHEMAARHACLFVVASVDIQYRRPARLDDLLAIDSRIVQRGRASLVFEQRCLRDADVLAEARIKIACVDSGNFRTTPLPDALEQALPADAATVARPAANR